MMSAGENRPATVRLRNAASLIFAMDLAGAAASAHAQSRGPLSVSVGRFTSEKTCTLYEESAGKSAFVATPYAIAAADSWRTWLVRDCVDNFASIRMSLQDALAASGKFVVRQSGGAYVVTGRISDFGGGGGPAPDVPTGRDGYSVSSQQMFVNADLALRDASGRILFGGLLTKHLETGYDIKTPGFRATGAKSGQALYGELQHEVAFAAARLIAFHLVPLKVVSGDGQEIQLNYGSPLLALGTTVKVTSPDGATTIRYNVTSAGSGEATAEIDGEGDVSRIVPGSVATVIEADDPAGRRLKRVELPE
jgi:hypothetical protein